jgi:uncharacterized surface protein with fasciclin (FAS1) repeats
VKAGLVETLSGDGPLLFLHRITLHLQNSGNGRNLEARKFRQTEISFTYHVVSGKFDAATVIDAINKNNGKYSVTTVQEEQSF